MFSREQETIDNNLAYQYFDTAAYQPSMSVLPRMGVWPGPYGGQAGKSQGLSVALPRSKRRVPEKKVGSKLIHNTSIERSTLSTLFQFEIKWL